MNSNSVLCRFIGEHPENWEILLEKEYRINIKKEGTYAIFNYGSGCNYSLPEVQEARGIILDVEKGEVVCWPFRKFGNYSESYADDIDWNHARVMEKVDGSIIKLWYDYKEDKWQFSTNGMIRAENAVCGENAGNSFFHVLQKADNFSEIPFDKLDKECTYIFELVSPETQVVILYEQASLFHIGTRNNITGQELNADIGIKKPKSYPLNSLQACVEAALKLNKNTQESITGEGFVVVDQNWNRVKIKSPDYIMQHHLVQMKNISKKECIKMLLISREEAKKLYEVNAELKPVFKYYDYQLAKLEYMADKMGVFTKKLYDEYDKDRKAVAKVICKHPLSFIGFRCINGNKKGSEYLMDISSEHAVDMSSIRICNLIPDYQEEDLYTSLFLE